MKNTELSPYRNSFKDINLSEILKEIYNENKYNQENFLEGWAEKFWNKKVVPKLIRVAKKGYNHTDISKGWFRTFSQYELKALEKKGKEKGFSVNSRHVTRIFITLFELGDDELKSTYYL